MFHILRIPFNPPDRSICGERNLIETTGSSCPRKTARGGGGLLEAIDVFTHIQVQLILIFISCNDFDDEVTDFIISDFIGAKMEQA